MRVEEKELAKAKFAHWRRMRYDRESLEIATPEAIAAYRAKRLACGKILDLCCGMGGDTIALAGECGRVVAIDEDSYRLGYAKANCAAYGRNNVEFVLGDVLALDLRQYGADYAFSDPTRRVGGRRVKALSETMPPTDALVKKLSHFRGYCVEASQQLGVEDIKFDCEREYLSLGGELVCLSLYFGELKKCERSAVSLPSGARLESGKRVAKPRAEQLLRYFYEPDPAVAAAGLVPELAKSLGLAAHGALLTSETLVESPFFKNSFELLGKAGELAKTLRGLGAGRVVLRGRLPPERQLAMKKELEAQLSGKKKLHIFVDENVVARSLAIGP